MNTAQLIAAITPRALAKGYVVSHSFNSDGSPQATVIARWSKGARPRLLAGVRIEPTGWVSDITLDLSVAKSFRPTEAELRVLLRLE
jgi:hypothetical protein